jgi:hypothetical protein
VLSAIPGRPASADVSKVQLLRQLLVETLQNGGHPPFYFDRAQFAHNFCADMLDERLTDSVRFGENACISLNFLRPLHKI